MFCEKLPKGKKMKIDPIDIKVNKDIEKLPEGIRPRPVLAHLREDNDWILDKLESAGLIEKLDVMRGTYHLFSASPILLTF